MFRFTIRDVLWLTVVVAMALGWSIHRLAETPALTWKRRAEASADFLREDGWTVEWERNGVSLSKQNSYRGYQWGPK